VTDPQPAQPNPAPFSYQTPAARAQAQRQARSQTAGLPPIWLRYRRLSGKEQREEGLSFQLQTEEITRYASEQGGDVGPLFEDVLTGSRDDRPGYQALLAECRRLAALGRTVYVVVIRLDRFGRSIMERARARNELTKLGVAVHSTREGGKVAPLTDAMLSIIAEHFLTELSQKVSSAAVFTISHGWLYPGVLPLGYRWRAATEPERAQNSPQVVAEVDPETAPLVMEAFTRAAAGEAVREVARWLHVRLGEAETPKAMQATYGAVHRLLRSPLYIARHPSTLARERKDGEAEWAAVLAQPAGRWPALVEDDVWLQAQRHRAGRRTRTQPRTPVAEGARLYPLTGFLRCPECGGPMHGEQTRQKHTGARVGAKEYVIYRYRCSSRMLKGAHDRVCAATVTAGKIEQAVADELAPLVETANTLTERPHVRAALRRALAEENQRREAAARLAGPTGADLAADTAAAARLEQTVSALDVEARSLTRKMGRGEIAHEEYLLALEDVRSEQRTAGDALDAIRARLDDAPSPLTAQPGAEAEQIDLMLGQWQALRVDGAQALAGDLASLGDAVRRLVLPGGVHPASSGGGKRAGRGVVYTIDLDLTASGHAFRVWQSATLQAR
jgi:hypothetical protein